MSIQSDRALHSEDAASLHAALQKHHQTIHTRGVLAADRRHLDDLAVDELHVVVAAQDASLRHTVVFVRRESPPLQVGPHFVPPLADLDIDGDHLSTRRAWQPSTPLLFACRVPMRKSAPNGDARSPVRSSCRAQISRPLQILRGHVGGVACLRGPCVHVVDVIAASREGRRVPAYSGGASAGRLACGWNEMRQIVVLRSAPAGARALQVAGDTDVVRHCITFEPDEDQSPGQRDFRMAPLQPGDRVRLQHTDGAADGGEHHRTPCERREERVRLARAIAPKLQRVGGREDVDGMQDRGCPDQDVDARRRILTRAGAGLALRLRACLGGNQEQRNHGRGADDGGSSNGHGAAL